MITDYTPFNKLPSTIEYTSDNSISKSFNSLKKWIGFDDESQIQLLTPSEFPPPKLRRTASNTNIDSICISVIKNPHTSLSLQQKCQIYKLTLQYTSRAFHQDIDTMTGPEIQDHFDHTTTGEYLFLATSLISSEEQEEEKTSSTAKTNDDSEYINNREKAPRVVFHLLCSTIQVEVESKNDNNTNNNNNSQLAMCCSGRCCDPTFQNSGIASIVHNAAVHFLKPRMIITRTVNPSILKLLRRNSPPGSKLYPNDLVFAEKRENTEHEEWTMVRKIATQAVHKWDQCRKEIEKYNPETMQFEGVYSNVKDEVFNNKNNNKKTEEEQESTESKHTAVADEFVDVPVKAGDAQLRIVMFPS